MCSFYVCKFQALLFCAYVLGLYFTGISLPAQKLRVEHWWNWAQGSISPTFYEQLLHRCSYIKKVQTFYVSTIKLGAKLLYKKPGVKCWWNWVLGSISPTFWCKVQMCRVWFLLCNSVSPTKLCQTLELQTTRKYAQLPRCTPCIVCQKVKHKSTGSFFGVIECWWNWAPGSVSPNFCLSDYRIRIKLLH